MGYGHGKPYLWENDRVQVLNFPTKRDWRENSRLKDIEAGLRFLAENYPEMGIYTLAMPPLGCGNGGLKWEDVKHLLIRYLKDLPDLEVFVYEPGQAESGRNIEESQESSQKPKGKGPGIAASP